MVFSLMGCVLRVRQMYHQSPSLILQGLVDSWIMVQEGVDDVDITVRLSEFPSPSYEDDGFWSGVSRSR